MSLMFFFSLSTASAPSSKSGAITHSMKPESDIALAVFASTFLFSPIMPPKAESVSQANASLYACSSTWG